MDHQSYVAVNNNVCVMIVCMCRYIRTYVVIFKGHRFCTFYGNFTIHKTVISWPLSGCIWMQVKLDSTVVKILPMQP